MLKSLFPWKHHKTKAMAAQQTMDDAEVPSVDFQKEELLPCHVCGRTFLPAPLKKHARICERTSTKKRKPFDSLRQRVEGTDLADFHQKSYLKRPEATSTPDLKRKGPSSWKEKHLALVNAIRAAKGIPSDTSTALPKPKSSTALMAGTERCPSCDRQFGPKAYDRHVEWCKEKKAQLRIHQSPANVLLAKERLEARTKYVPPLNRSKKTIIREKYSNHTSTETLVSVKSTSPLSRGPSVRKPRSVMDMGRGGERGSVANNVSEEKREKFKFERSVSGGGDKAKTQEGAERCVPVIGSPSSKSEVSKSFQKKRMTVPFTKLNNVKINNQFGGLTVAPLIYDSSAKKMVTWKDTVRRSEENVVEEDEKPLPPSSRVKKEISKVSIPPEVICKPTRSEKLEKVMKKIHCEKILSTNDIPGSNQLNKIPLSKYSFKSKLNLLDDLDKHASDELNFEDVTSTSSNQTLGTKLSATDVEELDLEVDKSSSCNSVATAFEKLKIDSNHHIKPERNENTFLTECKNDLVDVPTISLPPDGNVLATRSEFTCFQNPHRSMSNWFDGYMRKADSTSCVENSPRTYDEVVEFKGNDDKVEYCRELPAGDVQAEKTFEDTSCLTTDLTVRAKEGEAERPGKEKPSENLVLLFKSATNLDLAKRISELTLTEKKSGVGLKKDPSWDTVVTNCELDSIELSYRKASHFSVKRSTSDMCVASVQSSIGLSSKNTLISIYRNKNRENSDDESLGESRKIFNSLPNIRLNDSVYKEVAVARDSGDVAVKNTDSFKEKESLRRKILEIAAKEFVEDCRNNDTNKNEAAANNNESNSKFVEEEYVVPKKKRKVDGTDCRRKQQEDIFRFSGSQNFDILNLKCFTLPKDTDNDGDKEKNDRRAGSSHSSSSSSTLCEASPAYSPRILALLDNVLNRARNRPDDKNVVVMTPSDCRRLIDLDREKLPELERRLRKMKRRNAKRRQDPLKLPAIGDMGRAPLGEDKEVQVDEMLHLPKIVDRMLMRRDTAKRAPVEIKKNVGDVYLEYDSESSRENLGYNPFESAQRQFMELLECDEFKRLTPTCTPVKHPSRPHTTVTPAKQPSPVNNKKTAKSAEPAVAKVSRKTNRSSVIDPPTNFKDSLDSISDDFELMENLINDNFTDDNKNNTNGFFLHLRSEKESLTLSDILDNRKYSDDMSSIDPLLINENDNLSIPEHFKIDDYSPTSTADTDITIQNDVDHYSVQYDRKISALEPKPEKKSPDKSKTAKSPAVKRSVSLVGRAKKVDEGPLRVADKKFTSKSKLTSKSVSSVSSAKAAGGERKKGLSTLKRSMTLFDPSPKPPPLKNKSDVDNYFTEQEQRVSVTEEKSRSGKELNDILDEALKPEDLFNVDDEMYEEYKKYEEMYLKEKALKAETKKHKPKIIDINLGVHTASEEEDHSSQFNNKISNDSAYGSLTRKTPKHRSRAATKLTPLEQKQADSTSSSGSENCPASPDQRLSKFCHECGNKYPVTTAKFCVECGVRRLVL